MMYFGLQIGVWVIFLGLYGNVYIAVRAIYEAVMQYRSNFDDHQHKRAHIATLGAIFAYSIYDIASFLWFLDIYQKDSDYTISFFNLFFVNIIWLFVIHHFKQERLNDYSKASWNKLLKF
jgi:hypothetical protein